MKTICLLMLMMNANVAQHTEKTQTAHSQHMPHNLEISTVNIIPLEITPWYKNPETQKSGAGAAIGIIAAVCIWFGFLNKSDRKNTIKSQDQQDQKIDPETGLMLHKRDVHQSLHTDASLARAITSICTKRKTGYVDTLTQAQAETDTLYMYKITRQKCFLDTHVDLGDSVKVLGTLENMRRKDHLYKTFMAINQKDIKNTPGSIDDFFCNILEHGRSLSHAELLIFMTPYLSMDGNVITVDLSQIDIADLYKLRYHVIDIYNTYPGDRHPQYTIHEDFMLEFTNHTYNHDIKDLIKILILYTAFINFHTVISLSRGMLNTYKHTKKNDALQFINVKVKIRDNQFLPENNQDNDINPSVLQYTRKAFENCMSSITGQQVLKIGSWHNFLHIVLTK